MEDNTKTYDVTIYLKSGQTIDIPLHHFNINKNAVKTTVTWKHVEGELRLMSIEPDEITAVTYKERQ